MQRLIMALAALALAACSADQQRYTTEYPCAFLFYTEYHPTSLLSRVLSNPGMFVAVKTEKRSGVQHVITTSADGTERDDVALTTEIEARANYSNVGAKNLLIIGCTFTGEWRAYDGQCPVCLSAAPSRRADLSLTATGAKADCKACHRKYDLNTGASDDGQRLLEYRIRTNGQTMMVSN